METKVKGYYPSRCDDTPIHIGENYNSHDESMVFGGFTNINLSKYLPVTLISLSQETPKQEDDDLRRGLRK